MNIQALIVSRGYAHWQFYNHKSVLTFLDNVTTLVLSNWSAICLVLLHQSLSEAVKTYLWRYHGTDHAWWDMWWYATSPTFFWNLKVHYCVHKCHSFPVLSQMNPVHTLPSTFRALQAAVILLLCIKPRSFIQDLVIGFPDVWTVFPLIEFCPSSGCMVLPLLSENHLNCFIFIHLFLCSLYQTSHALLSTTISSAI